MENKRKPSSGSDGKTQSESKYDSHSEEKPTQKTTVVTDENPDRVSHDNTDNYIEKLPNEIEKAQEAENAGDKEKNSKKEWDASFYPKKSTSLQGN